MALIVITGETAGIWRVLSPPDLAPVSGSAFGSGMIMTQSTLFFHYIMAGMASVSLIIAAAKRHR